MFWPNAVTKEGKELHTYEPCINGLVAMNVFYTWEQDFGFNLKKMWVDIVDNDTGEKRRMKVERRYEYVDEEVAVERDCKSCDNSKDNHINATETCHLCMWKNQYQKREVTDDISDNS